MINYYDTLVEAHEALRNRGFTANFGFKENSIINLDSKKTYTSDKLEIVEYHRFEGMSNPSDSSIILALETDDGIKGTAVSSFGNHTSTDLLNFLDKVKIQKRVQSI